MVLRKESATEASDGSVSGVSACSAKMTSIPDESAVSSFYSLADSERGVRRALRCWATARLTGGSGAWETGGRCVSP